jgi:hypothetical protein
MCKKDSQGEESSRDWNVAIRGGNKANKQAGRVGLMTMQDNARKDGRDGEWKG